jgi:hypothetical protein
LSINLQEKLPEDSVNSYFNYWQTINDSITSNFKFVYNILGGNRNTNTNEISLINKLSLYNSKKDSSLLKTTKTLEDENKRKDYLKSSLFKDKPCDICNKLAQQAKFVGNCCLCYLF